MEADGVDVWHVGIGGSVDLRMSRHSFRRMKARLPGCREEGSVEGLLRQAEMLATKQLVNRTQEDWFEDYVSYTYSSILGFISFCTI